MVKSKGKNKNPKELVLLMPPSPLGGGLGVR